MESVQYIISSTRSLSALFTKKANSVHNNMADNSFPGSVASISFDLEAKIVYDHSPGLSFLPAYITAPSVNSAASDKQINLILETDSSNEG